MKFFGGEGGLGGVGPSLWGWSCLVGEGESRLL